MTHAIITGGLGALGRATVETFEAAGCQVTIFDRGEPRPGNRPFVQVDLTDAAAVRQAVEAAGQVDILIGIAGGWGGGPPVWESRPEDDDRLVAGNLASAWNCCRAVLPGMVERNAGRIVLVSSRTAIRPEAGQAAYAIAKRAILALVETVALEVQNYKITINAVVPSVIDTPANRTSMPDADPSNWVTPATIAAVMRWLTLSEEAWAISGAAIPVYGRA